ncbi:MAG: S41 family peptidase [Bacteroidota bacterium]
MKSICICILSLLTIIAHGQTTVEFIATGLPQNGKKHVGIRGDLPPLSWYESVPMKKIGDQYTVTLDFPKETKKIEFKIVQYDSDQDKKINWEGIENRSLDLVANEKIVSINEWNTEQTIDISTLPLLTPEQLADDYQLIEEMVLNVHPGTYRYNSKEEIKKGLAELQQTFSQPISYAEAYLAISKLLGQIQCDHTYASFYNQNGKIKSILHRQRDKLPFTFKWANGKMIVFYNVSENSKLVRGTEIISINGTSVEEIKNTILPYIPADGATDHNRLAKLEIKGYDFRYDAFDVCLPLFFPFKDENILLQIKPFGSEVVEEVTVKAVTRKDRTKKLIQKYADFPATRDDIWDFKIIQEGVAILKLGDFGLMGWKSLTLDYKEYFKSTFKKIKEENIQHLIIDIRENAGGFDEIILELYNYFDIKGFNEKIQEGRTRYTVFPESLKPHIKTWGDNPWYFNMQPDEVDEANGYYIFKDKIKYKHRKKRNAFGGKIYVLTNAVNGSLAYYFPKKVKQYQLATIVGQETGGNMRGINGGQILFLKLPNSEINIDFPIMSGFSRTPQPNRGVQPDIEVITTQQDIYEEVDKEVEVVLGLINK